LLNHHFLVLTSFSVIVEFLVLTEGFRQPTGDIYIIFMMLFFALYFYFTAAVDIVNLQVPMVHQRWDVPSWYDGSWGCGPTSTVMSLAFWKRLAPHTIDCPNPEPHTNDFGWYLPNNYTMFGYNFDVMDLDPLNKPAWGAYGFCTVNGSAWADHCADFIERHHLVANFSLTSTWEMVKAALDKGHPVVLDTRLTSGGHIILIRGYDSDSNMIVNDPYGNAHDHSTWGKLINGEGVRYTFDFVKAHWMIEVSLPTK